MHNIQEEKDYSKPINSLKDKLMQLKKDVSTVSKAHAKTEKAVQKTVDDKDQALTPEDHQAAMSHFRGLYQNAKRNKDDSGANEAARQYHDYANKLSDIYQRKLKEETMNPYLQEDMQLDENLAVHGKYTIKSGPAISGMGEGSPDHVTAHKGRLKAIGVKADRSEQDGRYGTTHRVTVKNNETGESTYHHVYQSGTHGTKPTMSVRNVGAARKNQEEHHGALKDYLSGKKPTTKYSGLASESVNQPVSEGLKPEHNKRPGWMLAADPKLRAAVNTAKAKQKEFKRLIGTKTNEEYDLTEETIDTSKDRQGKIKVGSKVRSYDFPGYHNDHYIEGHVHQETPHSYHIQVSKVVRAGKEMPIPAHMHHVEAPKGKGHFTNHYAVHPLKEEVELGEADFSKYIMKPTKTEPKIVRKTNPAGRTTDHVEYEVHGTLSSHKRTFKSKKDAEAYFDSVKEEVDKEHQKILDRDKTSTPRKPKGEYERKVSSYLRKKYQKEEVEQIDELSKKTLTAYNKKAVGQLRRGDVSDDKAMKRDTGAARAQARIFNTSKSPYRAESVEQIDEISAKLRDRYVYKATDAYGHHNFAARASEGHPGLEDYSKAQAAKAKKRAAGLNAALSDKRLGREVKESYEKAEKHKDKATKALETSDMEAFHHHMSNHHEEMGQWHESKGRHSAADREYSKAELHHEKSLKPSYNDTIKSTNEAVSHLSELSTDLLARYKKKAGEQATELDKEGFASTTPRARSKIALDKAHQRFKGINKATMKQFDNDAKR